MTRAQIRQQYLLAADQLCAAADPDEIIGYAVGGTKVCWRCYRGHDGGTPITAADGSSVCPSCRRVMIPHLNVPPRKMP